MQRPEYLLERIVLASTKKGDAVPDPFCGSGTIGMVSGKYKRQFIGTDNSKEYLDIAKRRLDQIQEVLGW